MKAVNIRVSYINYDFLDLEGKKIEHHTEKCKIIFL